MCAFWEVEDDEDINVGDENDKSLKIVKNFRFKAQQQLTAVNCQWIYFRKIWCFLANIEVGTTIFFFLLTHKPIIHLFLIFHNPNPLMNLSKSLTQPPNHG